MDVPSDPRFVRAVGRAVETIPEGIGAEMDRLAVITEENVAEAIARYESACEEMRERFGSKARTPPPLSTEMARKGLEAMRRNALDWLFFRHWRLADGWLPPEEAERALAIFHDRLAIGMRRAVAAQRYPGLPYLANR